MKLVLALLLSAVPAAAIAGHLHGSPARPNYDLPAPKEGYSYPDCFCTDSDGERVEIGETACLSIGSRQVLARCGFSVNNPAWRTISEGCPGV